MNKLLPTVTNAMAFCKSKMNMGGATSPKKIIYKKGGSTKGR